jgi:hypothetical protein
MSRFLALALLLALPACNDSIPSFSTHNQLLPTVGLENQVAFVEKNFHTAFILDPADPTLTPRQVSVGKAPIAAVKRNGSNQLLVLSRGDRGSDKDAPIPAQLQSISADPAVAPLIYPLTSRFDGLAQSGDGATAILYHTSSTQNVGDTALFDPNELNIVDLARAATANVPVNPTSKSIRSAGGVPTGIVFLPPFTFRGETRTLAVVLALNYITIFDLGHLTRTEITVPLSPDGNHSFNPAQVLFDAPDPSIPGPAKANIYVRADGSNDIFQITLTDLGAQAEPEPSNDFYVSLSMLAAGSGPADMALYQSGTGTRLAVAAPGSKTLVILDPDTSRATSITTGIPVNRIVLFNGAKPGAPTKLEIRALLVDVSGESTSVLFADLKDIETSGALSLEARPLGGAATSVVPLVDQGIAVLMFGGRNSGDSALAVVDLATRTPAPVGSERTLGGAFIEKRGRLWGVDSQVWLGYLNLVASSGQARLSTGEVLLDQTIVNVLPLEKASPSNGKRYVVVEHGDPDNVGNVTLLDADTPERAGARTAYGFLLTNYLTRGQP